MMKPSNWKKLIKNPLVIIHLILIILTSYLLGTTIYGFWTQTKNPILPYQDKKQETTSSTKEKKKESKKTKNTKETKETEQSDKTKQTNNTTESKAKPLEKPTAKLPWDKKTTTSSDKQKEKETEKNTTKESETKTKLPTTEQNITYKTKVTEKDAFDDEIFYQYQLDKTLNPKDSFQVQLQTVNVAKMSPDSMKAIDLKGEGVVDLMFLIENKGKETVAIQPSKTSVTIDGNKTKELKTTLRDADLKESDQQHGSLSIPIAKWPKEDTIKKIQFDWFNQTPKEKQVFHVTIELQEE